MKMKKLFCLAMMAALMCISCQESLEDKCAKEAAEFTSKKCPSKIDENTEIDSMTFDKSTHTLAYWYKLTGKADNPIIFERVNLRKSLVEQIKNSTSLQAYKDAGYKFRYVYRSQKENKIYFDATVTKKEYK